MAKLTSKQQKFVEAYLISLNASKAALEAGYSKKTAPFIGAENLKKPQIADAIEKAKRKVSEKMEITLDDCLRGLHGIAEDDNAPAAARTSAWTTLAKMCGHFVERRKVESDGKLTIEVIDYSKAKE